MKIAQIPSDGTPLYYSPDTNWSAPTYGQPGRPVTRVDAQTYYRTYGSFTERYVAGQGRYIKLHRKGAEPGTYFYAISTHVRGLYVDVYPVVKAHCDARDAQVQAERDELARRKAELALVLAQLAERMGENRPVASNPTGWQVERDGTHVTVSVHGLRAMLGHIRRQDELIEALERDCAERYEQLRVAGSQGG